MVHISLESEFMAKVEEVCSKIKFCVHVLNGFLLAVVAGADVWLGTPCLAGRAPEFRPTVAVH